MKIDRIIDFWEILWLSLQISLWQISVFLLSVCNKHSPRLLFLSLLCTEVFILFVWAHGSQAVEAREFTYLFVTGAWSTTDTSQMFVTWIHEPYSSGIFWCVKWLLCTVYISKQFVNLITVVEVLYIKWSLLCFW